MKLLRCAWAAAPLLVMPALLLAVEAAAKEPQNYGRLTIQITGVGGTQRTFPAKSPEEQQDANALVTELGMVTSTTTLSASPPPLSRYYQISVKQEPGAGSSLPWSAFSSAEFYYYPGRGQTSPYLRCRIGRGSQPDHEVWLIAFPAVQSLIEPHLRGLAPMESALQALPLPEQSDNPVAVIALSLLLLATVVTAITLVSRRLRPRRSVSQRQVQTDA